MAEEGQACFRVEADHPCLSGHFPGNPIVPGVVLLDELLAALDRVAAVRRIRTIKSMKFLATVKADEEVELDWSREGQKLRFEMKVKAVPVASGSLIVDVADGLDS